MVQKPDHILNMLEKAGYEAYYVGGCVRDSLLGRPIHDWDITTSALPEQTMACFEKTVPTGIRHGTITVIDGGVSAEVTTYRTDGIYLDGRHPEQVCFVRALTEDLRRRDFTINAMAMDRFGQIVDPHNGTGDLRRRLIRCVGDPDQRFQEDALRMFRAVRFSSQLGFSVDKQTWLAIEHNASLVSKISIERIRDEMEKTLLSDRPQGLNEMASLGLLDGILLSAAADCSPIALLPPDRTIRWAALCRIWPQLDLTALRLDRHTAKNAMTAGRLPLPQNRQEWKRCLAVQGKEIAVLAAAISGQRMIVDDILSSGECVSLRQLAVTGKDLPQWKGKALGEQLHKLLEHVLEFPNDNEKEILLKISKNSIDYYY